MNKTEKLICLVLGAVLAWYVFNGMNEAKKAAAARQAAIAAAATNGVEAAGIGSIVSNRAEGATNRVEAGSNAVEAAASSAIEQSVQSNNLRNPLDAGGIPRVALRPGASHAGIRESQTTRRQVVRGLRRLVVKELKPPVELDPRQP